MLSVKGVYQKGRIKLDEKISTDKKIPVIVTFLEDRVETSRSYMQYRFSDLAGKLEWQGDAVALQRETRNEWPD